MQVDAARRVAGRLDELWGTLQLRGTFAAGLADGAEQTELAGALMDGQ